MVYDWSARPTSPDLAWFDAQDRLMLHAHRFITTERRPYEEFIPFSQLAGKEVLEIGVGAGFHSELMARAGARVTGIDITDAAIATARHRFALKELPGRFERWDAELARPDFDRRFDFIWSWGVIHISSRTARIVRNAADWLTDGGRFGGMVFHRDSMTALVAFVLDGICRLRLRSHSFDETLWRASDGYSTRFYPADQWQDLLLGFFDEANVHVTGQEGDILPLPRSLRRHLIRWISPERSARILARVGTFAVFEASRPLRK
jgi:SAM-dependent methyltransferase